MTGELWGVGVGEQQAVAYQSSTSNLLGVGAKSTLGATIWEIWTPRGGISDTEKKIKLPPPHAAAGRRPKMCW